MTGRTARQLHRHSCSSQQSWVKGWTSRGAVHAATGGGCHWSEHCCSLQKIVIWRKSYLRKFLSTECVKVTCHAWNPQGHTWAVVSKPLFSGTGSCWFPSFYFVNSKCIQLSCPNWRTENTIEELPHVLILGYSFSE